MPTDFQNQRLVHGFPINTSQITGKNFISVKRAMFDPNIAYQDRKFTINATSFGF